MKKWTDKEKEILKNNYGLKSNEDLCQLLPNRTLDAIQIKASQLRLTWLTPEQRFWKYVNKKSDDECWNWVGYIHYTGYGVIQINKKQIRAHRFSWVLHNGTIPNETPCVLHRCDNSKCVNLGHLFLGTRRDNTHDMVAKNRQAKGEDINNSKLTSDKVKKIRSLKDKFSQKEIAKMFDVTQKTISCIHTNKQWKHVK